MSNIATGSTTLVGQIRTCTAWIEAGSKSDIRLAAPMHVQIEERGKAARFPTPRPRPWRAWKVGGLPPPTERNSFWPQVQQETCTTPPPKVPLLTRWAVTTMAPPVATETIASSEGPQKARHRTVADSKKGVELPPSTKDEHDQFFWTYTEEPHRTRRQAIIKAHPEVRHISDVLRVSALINSH